MKHRALQAIVIATAGICATGTGRAQVERSVVRVVNHSQRADWSTPWNSAKVDETSGSGFAIRDGLVMTNAHVVSDARLLLLHVPGDPEPYEARVEFMGHDCDLALVRPLNPEALRGVGRLAFGTLPRLGSSVDTFGYPTGGLRVSSTRGVVSRIEEQTYVHSGVDRHLAVQVDAAINPGSSGGPVVQQGRVVGVAFQNNPSLENVGFFIPTEVIERFLRDVEDGRYDGYPDLGFDTSNMENPAARAHDGMTGTETGVHVDRVYRGSSSDGLVHPGDIILAANDSPVANDGSVADGDNRIPFGLLIDRMFVGEIAVLRVLRAGRRIRVEVPLLRHPLVETRRNAYDTQPRYYIYGGLVFIPLNRETLKISGSDWRRIAPRTFLDDYYYRIYVDPDLQLQERVLLMRRLDDPVNAEMAWFLEQVVERVNGRRIDSLRALVDAFEEHEGAHHMIEFAHGRRFSVLDRERAAAANPSILQRYGIQRDRNP